jgi:purine-binding chemotaxis protein CheW
MSIQNVFNKTSYLTFELNNELFAIEAVNVIEILELSTFTIVPNAPEHLKGIINFRGEIVPIVDMHRRFNMDVCNNSTKMVIIVNIFSEGSKVLLGLLVDEVRDVIEIDLKDIRNVPEFGLNYNIDYLTGMVEVEEKFFMILNIANVLSFKELSGIAT